MNDLATPPAPSSSDAGYDPNSAQSVFGAKPLPVESAPTSTTNSESSAPDAASPTSTSDSARELMDGPDDAKPKADQPAKKKSALDKVTALKKPEPDKAEATPPSPDGGKDKQDKPGEKVSGKTKEENFAILRQHKEELEKLKPEFETTKAERDQLKTELQQLKALGLTEKERAEYTRYRDLHAVEAVKSSAEFKSKIEQPIIERVNKVANVAKHAGLDETASAALMDACDIPDEFERNKAIRGVLQRAELEVEDYQTLAGIAIAAAKDLNDVYWPKEDQIISQARDVEAAARQREQQQAQEMTAKEKAEFQKEHEAMFQKFSGEYLKPLMDDADLAVEGVTLADALKNSAPGETPAERAAEVHALAALPFVITWAQKMADKAHQLEEANRIRNGSTPARSDGLLKEAKVEERIPTADEMFKGKW